MNLELPITLLAALPLSNPSTGLIISVVTTFCLCKWLLNSGSKRIRWLIPVLAAAGVAYWQGVERSADLPKTHTGSAVSVCGYIHQTTLTSETPARTVAKLGDTTGKMLLRFAEGSSPEGWLVFAQGIVTETSSGGKFVDVKSYFGCPFPLPK